MPVGTSESTAAVTSAGTPTAGPGLGESLHSSQGLAFDVGIVEPNTASHSGAGACSPSFLNPNAGTRPAEKDKTDRYKSLVSATWYGTCTDYFHSERGYGRAAPKAILAPALGNLKSRERGR